MTDQVDVLVQYSRFLECRDRRQRTVAELELRDQPAPIDPDVAPAAAMPPSPPLTAGNTDH
jgi:hypothetical protein